MTTDHPVFKQLDPSNQLDLASEAYRQAELMKRHNFKSTAEALVIASKRRNRVPVDFFDEYLLPVVRAWVRGDKDNENYGHWMNIAGGMYNELEIVDRVNGETLFIVPPPYCKTPVMVLQRQSGKPVMTPDNILSLQDAMRDNQDMRGFSTIEAEIPTLYDIEKEEDLSIKYVKQYYAIYTRYQLPLEELLGPDSEELVKVLQESDSEGTNVLSEMTDTDPLDDDTAYEY